MESTQVSGECRAETGESGCCVTCTPAPTPAAETTPAPALSGTRGSERSGGLPTMPGRPEMTTQASVEMLALVRRFCAGDREAGEKLSRVDDSCLPAALYPYRNAAAVRSDYPLLLSADAEGVATCTPIADCLSSLCAAVAPEADQGRVLKDNLLRLEQEVRALCAGKTRAAPASTLFEAAGRLLEQKLTLKGESGKQLHADLGALVQVVPSGALLLPMSEHAPLEMYLFAARGVTQARAKALTGSVKALRGRVRDVLALERGKGVKVGGEEKLARAVGGTGHQLDAAALARLLDRSLQKQSADTARCQRLERVLGELDRFLSAPPGGLVHVISTGDSSALQAEPGVRWLSGGLDPCAAAGAVFDEVARAYTSLFVAMRTARLEIEGAYDPRRHDTLATTFDWRAFTSEELRQLPPVLVIEEPDTLANRNMRSLSRLLLSGRPLDVVVLVSAATDPGASAGEALSRYRMELGYLAMGHREALVNQSSCATPAHLLGGFTRGLAHDASALHVVMLPTDSRGGQSVVGPWLFGGAALEARAHPVFHYDPQAGRSWAQRLDFSRNPSPEADWPVCEIGFVDAGGQAHSVSSHFTFADFALLDGAYADEFRVLPAGLESPSLFEAGEYLALDPSRSHDAVPFVWAADGQGVLHRVAFTRRLGFVCLDRLNFWRTLQELAGVRNEYVRQAAERERAAAEADFARRREELEARHEAELATAREQTAGEALQRLAAALVNTDIGTFAGAAVKGAPIAEAAVASAPATAGAEPTAASAPEPAAVEEVAEPAEPWVDTVLCTSCNDCININSRMFKYNANKQVVLSDPAAGTFAQLVQAAEKCPARCIHPGKPVNPSEPGLEALIERAKPFN